jgi:hypothetical protein
MILAKNVNSFYQKHKSEILKLVYAERAKPISQAKTSFVHLDKNGHTYTHYENQGDLPLVRYAQVLEYIQFIAKGLTAQEDERLDGEIEAALETGLKGGGGAAVTIGAVINEKKKRRKICLHYELICNYLMVQWIRDDEDPGVFDNEIQLQKVEMLKEEKGGETGFFFQQPELKRLHDLLQMSKEDWERYTREYHTATIRLNELLLQTASSRLSKVKEKTSAK